jgi:hypothetical protein
VKVIKNGRIETGRGTVPLPDRYRVPVKSEVLYGTTLAFSSPLSCKIFVIGLVP